MNDPTNTGKKKISYNGVNVTSAFVGSREVFGTELQNIINNLDNWDTSQGTLVVNLENGSKIIKTERRTRAQ